MTDAPMTHADVAEAVGRLKAYTGYPGQRDDILALLASHSAQAAEIERLKENTRQMSSAMSEVGKMAGDAEVTLSEHKAVLAEVVRVANGVLGSLDKIVAYNADSEDVKPFDILENVLTRATALLEKADG